MGKYLPLGTHVTYSHRAASVKRDFTFNPDGSRGEKLPTGSIESRDVRRGVPPELRRENFRAPTRILGARAEDTIDGTVYPAIKGKPAQLDRWVLVWPVDGDGYIGGLTFRSEGIWDVVSLGLTEWGDSSVETYLQATASWPLYEVKANLRGRGILVPVWAVVPDA